MPANSENHDDEEEEFDPPPQSLADVVRYYQHIYDDMDPSFYKPMESRADALKALKHLYRDSDCKAFAAALHKKTRWPIVKISENHRFHMVCRTPDDCLVDVGGYVTLEGVSKKYKFNNPDLSEVIFASMSDLDPDRSDLDPWHERNIAAFVIDSLPHVPFCDLELTVDLQARQGNVPSEIASGQVTPEILRMGAEQALDDMGLDADGMYRRKTPWPEGSALDWPHADLAELFCCEESEVAELLTWRGAPRVPEQWSQDKIVQEARFHEGAAGRYKESHVETDMADWRYEEAYSVENLVGLRDDGRQGWLNFLAKEIRYAKMEEREGYSCLVIEDIREPLVLLALEDGRVDIWDGWHRMAAEVAKDSTGLRAIVGTVRPEPAPEPEPAPKKLQARKPAFQNAP